MSPAESWGVVVPVDPATARGKGERGAAWRFVRERLAEFTVTEGVHEGDWCKALAVAAALQKCDSEVVIVHDADVFVPPAALRLAVAGLHRARWSIPHGEVWRYDERSTQALYEGTAGFTAPTLTRWPYLGVAGGGIVALRRADYDRCPLDPGFVGWGAEDHAWGWALQALYGDPWRGDVPLVHLWHPSAMQGNRIAERFDSELLRRNYRHARSDPAHLQKLLDRASVLTRERRG